MRLVTNEEYLTEVVRGAVVALGNFDGVHRGHQAVVERARCIGQKHCAPVAVLTFHPHPQDFFGSREPASEIASLNQRVEKLASFGVNYVFAQKFDAHLAKMGAAEFVERVLIRRLGARHIVTGENYRFGRGREGDVAVLSDLARCDGVDVTAVPSAGWQGDVCSSTAIRDALRKGHVEKAASLLGTPWELQGKIEIRGWRRGISFGAYVRPAPGAYEVRVTGSGWTSAGTATVSYPDKLNSSDFVQLRLEHPDLGDIGEVVRVCVLRKASIASGVLALRKSEYLREPLRQDRVHESLSF